MQIQLADCDIDTSRRTVTRDGEIASTLTSLEAELLEFLAERPRQVISRETLLIEVWGYAPNVSSRAADNAIKRLRAKLEQDRAQPAHLLTVHGKGYRFEPLAQTRTPRILAPSKGVLQFDSGISVDLDRMQLTRGEERVALSGTEVQILTHLREHGVVDRVDLRKAVWGREDADSHTVESAVRRLRSKLGPGVIQTIRLQGYKLEGLIEADPEDPDFVGRADDIGALLRVLETDATLVTLRGPGGMGKTSLTRRALPEATWVNLIGVADEQGILGAICDALGVLPRGGRDRLVERVARLLASSSRVVVDNCEQLVPELKVLVPELIERGVSFLATSRQPLEITGERVVVLQRLSVEAGAALYRRRVTQAHRGAAPAFDEDQVAALVEAVDGIPLAIELAAARASVLPLGRLLDRLKLDLLAGGEGRHHTMRATIETSWALLDPAEQHLLALLAHLPGGFTLELAERVAGGPDVLDALQSLQKASLLHQAAQGRLALYEPIREFALEQPLPAEALPSMLRALAPLGEPSALRRLRYREHADERRFYDERTNLIALAPLARDRAPEVAAHIALAASHILVSTGPARLGIDLLEGLVAPDPELVGVIHMVRANLYRTLDESDASRTAIDDAVETLSPDSIDLVHALNLSAQLHIDFWHTDAAGADFRRAEAAAERLGRNDLAAFCRSQIANYCASDWPEALREAQAARRFARPIGDLRTTWIIQYALAMHHWRLGQLVPAVEAFQEAAELSVELGLDDLVGHTYASMCQLRVDLGDRDGVPEELDRAIAVSQRLGDGRREGLMFSIRAQHRMATGDLEGSAADFRTARGVLDGQDIGARWWCAVDEARLWLLRGDPARAEHAFGQALTREGRPLGHENAARLVQARLRLAQGRTAEARSLVQTVREGLGEDDVLLWTDTLSVTGQLDHAKGEDEAARQALDEATNRARAAGISSALAAPQLYIAELRRALAED